MKKIFIIMILSIITNVFPSSSCCLTHMLDSLKSIPTDSLVYSPYKFVKYLPEDDSFYNSNTCNSFQFSYLTEYKEQFWEAIIILKYQTWIGGELLPILYTTVERRFYNTRTKQSIVDIKKYQYNMNCDEPAIEKKTYNTNETVLNMKVFNIQGKLIYTGNKFNGLPGLYIVKYITNKRTYFQKKIIY